MAIFQLSGATLESDVNDTTAPLVVLFERDDAIAVPLLSQLRLAGYDVRAARTPVELFDILGKHLTSLVLIDFGSATAGRREFWVALDAHRRGRAVQVMTFRYLPPAGMLDTDFEPSARALADVEVHGAHEFQLIIEGVRQRIPLHGGGAGSGPHALGAQPFGMQQGTPPPGGIAPIGAALGVPSPFMSGPMGQALPAGGQSNPYGAPHDPYGGSYDQTVSATPSFPFANSAPDAQPFGYSPYQSGFAGPGAPANANPFAQPGFMVPTPDAVTTSPFAQPASANPYASGMEQSPFAQPLAMNPFAEAPTSGGVAGPSEVNPFAGIDWNANGAAGMQLANPFAGPTAPLTPPGMPSQPAWGMTPPAMPSAQPSWPPYGAPSGPDAFGSPFQPRSDALGNGYAQADLSSGFNGNEPSGPFGAYAAFGATQQPEHLYGNVGSYGNETLGHPGQGSWGAAREEHAKQAISDVWTPPDLDGETGVVPEIAFQSQPLPPSPQSASDADWLNEFEQPQSPRLGFPSQGPDPLDDYLSQDDTAPIPTPPGLPAIRHDNPAERALSSVLVEGALVSSQRMDALKGIQQMLATVEMNFKLGELALLFKFLSPYQ